MSSSDHGRILGDRTRNVEHASDGPTLVKGSVLASRFEIKRFVARGGMGEVYEVDDLALKERVALKTIARELSTAPVAADLFKREIRLAHKVTHPNVCRIFDIFENIPLPDIKPGLPSHISFLTMEFLEGETLNQYLKSKGRLSVDEALLIVTQICEGLEAAHAAGVIHRDLKSSNVILIPGKGTALRAVVTDFGVARIVTEPDAPTTLTSESGLVGTAEYIAPEQIQKTSITPAADIYALGVVMFEIVTGKFPFTGETRLEMMLKRLQNPPVSPTSYVANLSKTWEQTILRCLELDPKDRFPSAQEVINALTSPEHIGLASDKRTLEVAHVLFMDIVGYSKLSIDQQEFSLRALQSLVRSTREFKRAEEQHRLISLPTGDGMALVFFENAEAPLRCAIEVSRKLQNAPEFGLRMGIHSGPVYRVADINTNENVAGNGINFAQRVMDCGDAAHILLSSSCAEILSQVSTWASSIHDIGEATVKHGVILRIFSFYNADVGNSKLPEKLKSSKLGRSKEYQHPADMHSDLLRVERDSDRDHVVVRRPTLRYGSRRGRWLIAAGVLILTAAVARYFVSLRPPKLSDKDSIVLCDFANTTGESVFDDTLKEGLSVQLEQSPFLNLISDRKVSETLKLMGRSAGDRLTAETAREVCQRTGSKVMLGGSIARLGNQYVLNLKAENCADGDLLGEEQVMAAGKEGVLTALGKAASRLREKLGESLASVAKYDIPLENVTTTSLEALQAFTLGSRKQTAEGDFPSAISFFQRAISLDPNFAMAYAALGTNYNNLGKTDVAVEYARKAYELRERVSEREKLSIASHYEDNVTGDLETSARIKELWVQTYPRDRTVPSSLATTYSILGKYQEAAAAYQQALKLDPENVLVYAGLVFAKLNLNQFDEAIATAREAHAHKLDTLQIHSAMYVIYFLQHNVSAMKGEAAELTSKGAEDGALYLESDTAAYGGKFLRARELTRAAISSALRSDGKESAAGYDAEASLREALVGNTKLATKDALAALALSHTRDVVAISAIALALTDNSTQMIRLANNLTNKFPKDTIVQSQYLPMIRAAAILGRRNRPEDAANAIKALERSIPHELGSCAEQLSFSLYPAYLRGEAYLAAGQGEMAAREFHKLIEHSGIVGNELIGSLAYLGVGRAYALQAAGAKMKNIPAEPPSDGVKVQPAQTADRRDFFEKSRTAYEQFFRDWKDADLDIPIVKRAHAEYAQLENVR